MRVVFVALVVSVLMVVAHPALARDAGQGWKLLERPGTVAIMRHAIAPGTGDPDRFRIADCSTQRNLDAAGRAQARRIGAAARAAGVRIDRVFSSEWCRCIETAELLGLGAVETLPALNSFFEDASTEREQTEAVRVLLRRLPATETVFLVTHQVNITALTGVFPASGEVLLLELAADGALKVLERILMRP